MRPVMVGTALPRRSSRRTGSCPRCGRSRGCSAAAPGCDHHAVPFHPQVGDVGDSSPVELADQPGSDSKPSPRLTTSTAGSRTTSGTTGRVNTAEDHRQPSAPSPRGHLQRPAGGVGAPRRRPGPGRTPPARAGCARTSSRRCRSGTEKMARSSNRGVEEQPHRAPLLLEDRGQQLDPEHLRAA
jgi:hypothetical protein